MTSSLTSLQHRYSMPRLRIGSATSVPHSCHRSVPRSSCTAATTAKSVSVTVDLSSDGPSASTYVNVELDNRDGFWAYRKAMEQPSPDFDG